MSVNRKRRRRQRKRERYKEQRRKAREVILRMRIERIEEYVLRNLPPFDVALQSMADGVYAVGEAFRGTLDKIVVEVLKAPEG